MIAKSNLCFTRRCCGILLLVSLGCMLQMDSALGGELLQPDKATTSELLQAVQWENILFDSSTSFDDEIQFVDTLRNQSRAGQALRQAEYHMIVVKFDLSQFDWQIPDDVYMVYDLAGEQVFELASIAGYAPARNSKQAFVEQPQLVYAQSGEVHPGENTLNVTEAIRKALDIDAKSLEIVVYTTNVSGLVPIDSTTGSTGAVLFSTSESLACFSTFCISYSQPGKVKVHKDREGTFSFEVDAIARKIVTEWYVNGSYQGEAENDCSGFFAVDPGFSIFCPRGKVTVVEAITYGPDCSNFVNPKKFRWNVEVVVCGDGFCDSGIGENPCSCPSDCGGCCGNFDCPDPGPCKERRCSNGVCSPTNSSSSKSCDTGGSGGACDAQDKCNGSGTCREKVKSRGTSCSSDGNDCTKDRCDGTNRDCKHPPESSSKSCEIGGSGGDCDAQDKCNGSGNCREKKKSSGTSCGGSPNGLCDAQDTCNGNGTCTPKKKPSGFSCRSASGECDEADTCNGSSTDCPDKKKSSGTTCGGSPNGLCDAQDTCDGNGTCTPKKKQSGFSCRSASGECDEADTCNGSSTDCPDKKKPSGTSCGGAPNGLCDAQNTCNGNGICDTKYKAAGTSCRTADGECDKAETCTGNRANCPVDGFQPDGTSCTDDGTFCNGPEECMNGTCVNGRGDDPCVAAKCDEVADLCCDNPPCECMNDAQCDDKNPCTNDKCVNKKCRSTNNTETCDDKDPKTNSDVCSNGKCSGTVINPCNGAACCDDNPCPNGQDCVSGKCVKVPICNPPCTPCTEICEGNKCIPAADSCGNGECESACGETAANCCEDCSACCDDNDCGSCEVCDNGACVFECDDDEVCESGVCKSDLDGDGVDDKIDECVNSPSGCKPESDGCCLFTYTPPSGRPLRVTEYTEFCLFATGTSERNPDESCSLVTPVETTVEMLFDSWGGVPKSQAHQNPLKLVVDSDMHVTVNFKEINGPCLPNPGTCGACGTGACAGMIMAFFGWLGLRLVSPMRRMREKS